MLSVLITVEFIRHCSDGRMRSEYIKSLLEGLRCVIRRLDSSLSSLKGWVSVNKQLSLLEVSSLNISTLSL